MTEEELEEEREAQMLVREMPRYGGKHAHLTSTICKLNSKPVET